MGAYPASGLPWLDLLTLHVCDPQTFTQTLPRRGLDALKSLPSLHADGQRPYTAKDEALWPIKRVSGDVELVDARSEV